MAVREWIDNARNRRILGGGRGDYGFRRNGVGRSINPVIAVPGDSVFLERRKGYPERFGVIYTIVVTLVYRYYVMGFNPFFIE
jgi:hypothetical protein